MVTVHSVNGRLCGRLSGATLRTAFPQMMTPEKKKIHGVVSEIFRAKCIHVNIFLSYEACGTISAVGSAQILESSGSLKTTCQKSHIEPEVVSVTMSPEFYIVSNTGSPALCRAGSCCVLLNKR